MAAETDGKWKKKKEKKRQEKKHWLVSWLDAGSVDADIGGHPCESLGLGRPEGSGPPFDHFAL